MGTERLCVPVCSCVEWSVKDWDAESQLCPLHPGTLVMLRGTLPLTL